MIAHLGRECCLVLEAPPGAGKTTRVPSAIDAAGICGGEIIVLEPRRLAARMAARRTAEERGEAVGDSVGYRVRFEEAVGPRTRVVFVTEGLLLRRLLSDPTLSGVGAVVLDEFHERHLHGDVALALCRQLQARRPELRLVVMSATLEAAPIAAFLGNCGILRAEGRRFDVAVEYLDRALDTAASLGPGKGDLEREVAQAVRRLVADGLDGDVLVFLPGAREIRRAAEACAQVAKQAELDVVPLHGDLSPAEQDRAVRPGPRKKIILSTNVAETSITIEGVVAVIDSGLARVASHSPWSGLPTLKVQKISRASATQRAGRAGRLRPGRCLRLYPRHDHDARPAHDVAEIRRSDLAETVLALAAVGVRQPGASPFPSPSGGGEGRGGFPWLETPPEPALVAAQTLLARLGALEADGAITALGQKMLRLPVHPRQARLILEAERRGVGRDGCTVAALIGEAPIQRGSGGRAAQVSGPADVLADLDLFAEARRVRLDPDRLRGLGLDVGATHAVDRVRKQLERLVSAAGPAPADPDAALGLSVLAGYPDRVARRRRPGGTELLLAAGGTAQLAASSVVQKAELMVTVEVEERSAQGKSGVVTVRSASAVEPEWLLDLFADRMRESTEFAWNGAAGRVDVLRRLYYDDLVLEEKRAPARPEDGEAASKVLAQAARERGAQGFADPEALERLLGRIAFARAHAPELGLPELGPAEVDAALDALCAGAVSFAALSGDGLIEHLLGTLDGGQRAKLNAIAPERVTLPGGRAVRITYTPGQPPFVASRLQDFFGMAAGPTIAGGRVPLTLHLLAPNQRAVQVTSDLAGFWERHYPAIRRELCRRYPRHAWPDDPLTARPPERRR